jgi:hypothetical protein
VPQDKLSEKGTLAGLNAFSDAPSSEKSGAHVGDGEADMVLEDSMLDGDGVKEFDGKDVMEAEAVKEEVDPPPTRRVHAELARAMVLPLQCDTKSGRPTVAITPAVVKPWQNVNASSPPLRNASRQLSPPQCEAATETETIQEKRKTLSILKEI